MATNDLLSTAEGRTAVGLGSDTAFDTPLSAAISAVSQQIDQLCGPVVNRTITDETHSGGGSFIRLKRRPVSSITSISEYANTTATALTAETNSTKTTSNYLHDGTFGTIHSGTIIRRTSNSDTLFPDGRGNIVVTYVAGRAANTAAVDPKFKQAAAVMLQALWTRIQASGSVTFPDQTDGFTVLLGPEVLNMAVGFLRGEILDGVYVG